MSSCQKLKTLDLAENRLTGSIPTEIFKLSNLTSLYLGQNLLGGSVPSEVGNLKELEYFDVSGNHLSENLTSSIGDCSSLRFLILARNNLSGQIPGSFGKLTSMEILDLSSNKFSRKILLDLENLQYLRKLNLSFNYLEGEVPIGKIFPNLSSFSLQGNNELYSSNQEIARTFGVSPCKTKRTIRKNMLKILASAAGATLVAASCARRCGIRVMLDSATKAKYCHIASAMDYLPNDCNPPIVHSDLKPENILLDEDLTAHVGDFGLARFISENLSQGKSSTIGLKGSIGYIAPRGKASRSGDVYRFGILLLEIFIAKKPTDAMFKEGLNLNEFASAMTLNGQALNHIIDPRLFKNINDGSPMQSLSITSSSNSSNRTNHSYSMEKYEECLGAVIRVGLACAAQNARDRLSIT
ncbi:hypothetical protein SLEP1_g55048 [Rubroshorea leprosula]|uniref:Protein kinase domain-containing protein n=1 Tax=Rubroshorea leprosula TaxID=152421 RepID=A0AAV5MIC9_9ROSI|nr:hypothetical protein SLEP1_g55048 [Rubroshorea leprosula]